MPGGRPKGSKNHQSKINSLAAKYELTPLNYMLEVLNDNSVDEDNQPLVSRAEKMEAAKAAAPYVHARLQSVVVQEKPFEGDPNSITNEQLAGIIARGSSLDDAAEAPGERTTH